MFQFKKREKKNYIIKRIKLGKILSDLLIRDKLVGLDYLFLLNIL